MTISSDVRRYIVELIAASENVDLIAKTDLLINAFETAGENQEKLQNAWQTVAIELNNVYFENSKFTNIQFHDLQQHLTSLITLINTKSSDIDNNAYFINTLCFIMHHLFLTKLQPPPYFPDTCAI